MAEQQRDSEELLTTKVQDFEKRMASKAEDWQTQRNELKHKVAELMKQLAEADKKHSALNDQKSRLASQLEDHLKSAESMKARLEEKLASASKQEAALKEQAKELKKAEQQAKLEMSAAARVTDELKSKIESLEQTVENNKKAAEARLTSEVAKVRTWLRHRDASINVVSVPDLVVNE